MSIGEISGLVSVFMAVITTVGVIVKKQLCGKELAVCILAGLLAVSFIGNVWLGAKLISTTSQSTNRATANQILPAATPLASTRYSELHQATEGTPMLEDKLMNNTIIDTTTGAYRWLSETDPKLGFCRFKDGAYHVGISTSYNHDYKCPAHEAVPSDFTLKVRMTTIKGIEGGIIFRRNGDNYYYFCLHVDRSYCFGRGYTAASGGFLPFPFPQNRNTSIHGQFQDNWITLIVSGDTFSFYVNDQYLDCNQDASYKSGEIGFAAGTGQDGTQSEVMFSDLQIWSHPPIISNCNHSA